MSMDYGMTEKLSNADVMASVNWNGSTFRARLNNPDVVYGYPQEGYIVWMDNAAILADAPNPENAKLFLDFIMDPENAALISEFARYANGIEGSEAFMPEEMANAPEINPPAELADAGRFTPACPAEAQEMYFGHLDRPAEVTPGGGGRSRPPRPGPIPLARAVRPPRRPPARPRTFAPHRVHGVAALEAQDRRQAQAPDAPSGVGEVLGLQPEEADRILAVRVHPRARRRARPPRRRRSARGGRPAPRTRGRRACRAGAGG